MYFSSVKLLFTYFQIFYPAEPRVLLVLYLAKITPQISASGMEGKKSFPKRHKKDTELQIWRKTQLLQPLCEVKKMKVVNKLLSS